MQDTFHNNIYNIFNTTYGTQQTETPKLESSRNAMSI